VVGVIITVTPNPAYDVTYELAELVVGDVHRVTEVRQRVGGKGLNVARILAALGESTVAMALADKAFAAEARTEGLDVDEVEVAGVRRTLVLHTADGTTTSLLEPGHPVSTAASEQLQHRVTARLAGATGLVVSGSLPPGVTADLPAQLASRAVAVRVPVVVDVDDEALRLAAKVPGVVLMPNRDELTRLVGSDCDEPADVVVAAQRLLDGGVAGVVATRGPDGLIAVTSEGAWVAALGAELPGNPTGAGDAAVAGVIRCLAAGDVGWPDLLRDAVAMSAAAVLAPAAGDVDLALFGTLKGRVSVTTMPTPRCTG